MKRGPAPGSVGRNKAEIAAIVIEAHQHGRNAVAEVMAHFDCSSGAARAAISRTRLAGHQLPLGYNGKRQLSPEQVAARLAAHDERRARRLAREALEAARPKPATYVVCACGQRCSTRMNLGRHTWAQHDRPPTDAERTLLAAERVAA